MAADKNTPIEPEIEIEIVEIDALIPHPKNYRKHPEDELEHIRQSIRSHGFYRNVVIASDNTILAGHGVVEAAASLDVTEVPCLRLPITRDDPRALQVLAGDNEIGKMAEIDDRMLTELLKDIRDEDPSLLLGTGYDDTMLAALALITRDHSELKDFDEAAEWVGMPEYERGEESLKIILWFRDERDRQDCAKRLDLSFDEKTVSAWFPPKPDDDVSSVKFKQEQD